MKRQNFPHYNYDIISVISEIAKYRKYLLPEPEPHHFYVDEKYSVTTTCEHLNHIMFYGHYQQNELIGLNGRLLFEKEVLLKKAFRTLRNIGDTSCKELVLKRKDNSTFWVLMCFRLENHIVLNTPQLLCQFININEFKTEDGSVNDIEEQKENLKKKIGSNQLKSCISDLYLFFNKKEDKETINAILIQESKFNLISKQQQNFIISTADYDLQYSKIISNLLQIIDEMK